MMTRQYTVDVGKERFLLSEGQILRSSYFSAAFLEDSGFRESETCSIALDRSPDLFRIIYDWLKGYDILPLSEDALPKGWSREVTLRNLTKDALFYGLDELVEALEPPNPKIVEAPAAKTKPVLLLPPLDFARGAWSGSTPNLAGPYSILEPIPHSVTFGQSGLVLSSSASFEQPVAVVLKASDVHASFNIDARQGTIRVHWTFMHPEDQASLQNLLPSGQALDLNTGCAAGAISRQVLVEADGHQFNFDAILVWAASKISGFPLAVPGISSEEAQALDSLFCVSTPLTAPEEGIRVSFVCKNLLFALFSGADGAYAAPLFMSAQPLSVFWSSVR